MGGGGGGGVHIEIQCRHEMNSSQCGLGPLDAKLMSK